MFLLTIALYFGYFCSYHSLFREFDENDSFMMQIIEETCKEIVRWLETVNNENRC